MRYYDVLKKSKMYLNWLPIEKGKPFLLITLVKINGF